jgi:pyruvate,water dikinase
MVFKPIENIKLNPISKDIAAKRIHDDLCRKERRNLSNTIINNPTTVEKQNQFSLNDKEVIQLSQWCYKIEKH